MTFSLIVGLILPCLMTTLGASLIFFFRETSEKWSNLTNSFSAGIMLSASIFSLLIPALEESENLQISPVIPVVVGFISGTFLIVAMDFFITAINTRKKHKFSKIIKNYQKIPQKTSKKLNFSVFIPVLPIHHDKDFEKKKATKFVTAITIHNIPEGLCVGLAIGSSMNSSISSFSAMMLAIGIALQNFPEGLATAMPIKKCLSSNKKAFFYAFLSGIVEPIFAILGILLSTALSNFQPILLAFSAGTMIYVIVEELLPETKNTAFAFMAGFVLMMILDLSF